MVPEASTTDALTVYKHRIDSFSTRLCALQHLADRLSNSRLFVFLGTIIVMFLFSRYGNQAGFFGIAATGTIIFCVLVFKHENVVKRIKNSGRLVEINRNCAARLDGGWRLFKDTGAEFVDDKHPYSKDLDIFGQGSLFQWVNAARTFKGRRKLAAALSNEHFDSAKARDCQPAIKELSALLDWRQNLHALSMESDNLGKDPDLMIAWMKSDSYLFNTGWKRWITRLFPLATPLVGLLVLLITGSYFALAAWIPLNLVFWLWSQRSTERILSHFNRHEESIKAYVLLLKEIEQCRLTTEYLCGLQGSLFNADKTPASEALRKLSSLTAIGQVRSSHMVGAVLNALFLWDAQAAILLESWKRRFGLSVEPWLDIVADFETVSSLSTIHHDNPDWCFAEFTDSRRCIIAEGIGHPLLIRQKRVCNPLTIADSGSVFIITGSNMSGKTTFLRTVGINMVLAFAGAPACATSLLCSPGQLLTSMRITDDLQNGISTFYAELLRIRKIIESLKVRSSIILIDEIFRGTNTHDRFQAAVHVLTYLAGQDSMTLISTHDLDIAHLEKKDPDRYQNFHFNDFYNDAAVSFDYILRKGPSNSSNAMKLIELIGIMRQGT